MQAYNLCYSTLISKTDAERQFPGGSGTAYKPSPQCVDGVHHFVTAQTRILEDILPRQGGHEEGWRRRPCLAAR